MNKHHPESFKSSSKNSIKSEDEELRRRNQQLQAAVDKSNKEIITEIRKRKSKLTELRLKLLELFVLTITAELFILTFINVTEIFWSIYLIILAIISVLFGGIAGRNTMYWKDTYDILGEKLYKRPINVLGFELERPDYFALICYIISLVVFMLAVQKATSVSSINFIGTELVCPNFYNSTANISASFGNYRNTPLDILYKWSGTNIQGYTNYFLREQMKGFQNDIEFAIPYPPISLNNEYTSFTIIMKIKNTNETSAEFSLLQTENNFLNRLLLRQGYQGFANNILSCTCEKISEDNYNCQ